MQTYNVNLPKQEQRNYGISVLKLFMTISVFVSHTATYAENSRMFTEWFCSAEQMGWVAVHTFFIISGFLMINSYLKHLQNKSNGTGSGKEAMNFVLNKAKGLILPFWLSLFIGWTRYICVYIRKGNIDAVSIIRTLIKGVPEVLMIKSCGVEAGMSSINVPAWYISAMLIAMLPLAYIMIKNVDSYLYVIAPFSALVLYAYMFKQDIPFMNSKFTDAFLYGGLIRALCGLCFGAVSFTVYIKLCETINNKPRRILITVTKIFLYTIIFIGCFLKTGDEEHTAFASMLLLPAAVAVTFSGKSYISVLFKHKFLQSIDPIILAIYLNHATAMRIVTEFYYPTAGSYAKCVAASVILTVVLCAVYFLLIRLVKLIWKKLNPVFSSD